MNITANIGVNPCSNGMFGWRCAGWAIAFVEKSLRFPIKRVAIFFEVHEMGRVSDLHVAFHGRGFQRIEEPVSIGVGSEAVPFAADNRDRRADEARIVAEVAGAGGSDVLPRPAGRLYTRRQASSALAVRVQVQRSPFLKVALRENRRLFRWYFRGEPIPLVLQGDETPSGKGLRLCLLLAPRDRSEENKQIDKIGGSSGKKTDRDRAPVMRDDRDFRHAMMVADEAYGPLDLLARTFGATEHGIAFGGLRHLRIGV